MSAGDDMVTTMAAITLAPAQSFRFLELPTELRYMVYAYFLDRYLPIEYPRKHWRGVFLDNVYALNCFHPHILLTSKQIRAEYEYLAFWKFELHIDIGVGLRYPDDKPRDISELILIPAEVLNRVSNLQLMCDVDPSIWPMDNPILIVLRLAWRMSALRNIWVLFRLVVGADGGEPSISQCRELKLFVAQIRTFVSMTPHTTRPRNRFLVHNISEVVCFCTSFCYVYNPRPEIHHPLAYFLRRKFRRTAYVVFAILEAPTRKCFTWRDLDLLYVKTVRDGDSDADSGPIDVTDVDSGSDEE